jgi:hypothetical protein
MVCCMRRARAFRDSAGRIALSSYVVAVGACVHACVCEWTFVDNLSLISLWCKRRAVSPSRDGRVRCVRVSPDARNRVKIDAHGCARANPT